VKVFDSEINALNDLTFRERNAMIILILVERSHLRAHTKQKNVPIYELFTAKGRTRLTAAAASFGHKSREAQSKLSYNPGYIAARYEPLKALASVLENPPRKKSCAVWAAGELVQGVPARIGHSFDRHAVRC
jgi:uncharacterized protein (TIGR03435 family)